METCCKVAQKFIIEKIVCPMEIHHDDDDRERGRHRGCELMKSHQVYLTCWE